MFKIPGRSTPVVLPQPPFTGLVDPTPVSNTAHPPPLTLAPAPQGERGIECLPMAAWHPDALPQPAPENRRLITRMAAGMLAWVRPPREAAAAEAAPASQAIAATTPPGVNRFGEQPAAHVALIASFLPHRDVHALSMVAHMFEGVPAANPGFMASKGAAELRDNIKALSGELSELMTKATLLKALDSSNESLSEQIDAAKHLDPEDNTPSVNARIKQVEAELEQAKSDLYDLQVTMAAQKRTAQADSETKAASQTSSSSSSSSSGAAQDMPMRRDQWAASQRRG